MSGDKQNDHLVPTNVQDFLDEDPPLRGQNFVCLSFLSPEEILANKEVFYFQQYLTRFSEELNKVVADMSERFPETRQVFENIKQVHPRYFNPAELQDDFRTFKELNSDRVEKAFHELNEFRTTVRGIKVRGVFDTAAEAKNRAEFLKRNGDKFDIFIGQVGCWCPWSPNPHDIPEQEYAETHLNTFMKKYKENMEHKNVVYEERKSARILQQQQEQSAVQVDELAQKLTEIDPWTESKSQ